MEVVKQHPMAFLPTKAFSTDAGWDLYALEDVTIPPSERVVVRTGLALGVPEGCAGLIWPRSGLAVKKGIDVLAGVIDHGYTGEVLVCLFNTEYKRLDSDYDEYSGKTTYQYEDEGAYHIRRGDKIAQIIIQPIHPSSLKVVESLSVSPRGDKGFGSSDALES
jgi:dUTP pyrophosphatase